MTVFFSIIIPTLNEEFFLPKLLKNLLEQKKQNFEVIIVDCKSKDLTKQIALKHTEFLPLTFIESDKQNVSYQRNLGGKTAKGQYLVFLDADVTINKTFTKTAQKKIEDKRGLIFLPYVMPENKKKYPEINIVFPLLNTLIEFSQNINRPFSAGGCMIWEKNFFQIIGGFEPILSEDHSIIRKAYLWGVKAKVIHQIKITFSSRRMKKEGRLKVLYKFFVSHFYLLFNKNIDKKMFSYEMGGHLYDQKILKKKGKSFDSKKLYKSTEKFFKTILSEE